MKAKLLSLNLGSEKGPSRNRFYSDDELNLFVENLEDVFDPIQTDLTGNPKPQRLISIPDK